MDSRSKIVALLLFGALIVPAIGCREKAPYPAQASVPVIEAAVQALEDANEARDVRPADEPIASPPSILYKSFIINGGKSLAELNALYGDEGVSIILKVNRIDSRHARKGRTLVVPEETAGFMDLSPFPKEIESAGGITKLLLVSRRVQAFAAYESGKLIRWGPVSTGKKSTPTPTGLYFTNWKAKETRSTVNSSWILPWCFNLDNFEGISFHQYEMPGFPASHGCVRLLDEDARWIYKWADQWILAKSGQLAAYGTPVFIFGDYDYKAQPPWKRLIDDPTATTVPLSELEGLLNKHLLLIESRAQARQTTLVALAQSSLHPSL